MTHLNRMSRSLALVLALLATAFTISAVRAQPTTPRDAFADAQTYAVYYGQGMARELAAYDVAIIQPDTLTAPQLRRLTDGGTLPIAYLSVGEVEPEREWFDDGRVPSDWILGQNPIWGSYYIDANQRGWQDLMLDLTGDYVALGFAGVFLDTVDTAELFPDTHDGMVTLIERLRDTYPDAVIVQNRGFSVLEDTAALVDGVMFECLSTTYDFDAERYTRMADDENDATIAALQDAQAEHGITVLALDYAGPDDADLTAYARERAEALGFLSFVTQIELQTLP